MAAVSDKSCPISDDLPVVFNRATHRTLKFCSLATATFNDVVEADLSATKLFGLPRGGARGTVTTTVAVHAVVECVAICLRSGPTGLAGPGASILA